MSAAGNLMTLRCSGSDFGIFQEGGEVQVRSIPAAFAKAISACERPGSDRI